MPWAGSDPEKDPAASEQAAAAFWAMGEFMHPLAIPATRALQERYGLGLDRAWRDFEKAYDAQRDRFGHVVDPERDLHGMPAADIVTRRRSGASLSSVQAFRPGTPGYQHHVWQATLGPRAVVFSTHPGSADVVSRPNHWAGNGILPLVGQVDDVVIARYAIEGAHVEGAEVLPFTHAYLPRTEFDDTSEEDGWTFASTSDGVVGLWCSRPTRRIDDSELRADDGDAVWVAVIGDGPLQNFAATWSNRTPSVVGDEVHVAAPGGDIALVGTGRPGDPSALTVAGVPVPFGNHPRFLGAGLDVPQGSLRWRREGRDPVDVDLEITAAWLPARVPAHETLAS
ncbi:hypothetical protein GCM10025867_01540 [Frondihabitans sucicola]|uniref:Uncharacterized protein n=1 Tax=Frondihabitans sucicola TaxID=1268041 RepID=A0ABM8GHS8_9MICO|nr:hypothetical protein [Frondihabitans sucicola]BDZ47913.1 hypothetical protein GCM10025867_01540 [Frondihabitans sucicola]